MGDAGVAQSGQIPGRFSDDGGLIVPNCRQNVSLEGTADDDGGEPDAHELVDTRIVQPQVDDEHAVNPVLAEPSAIHGDLLVDVADELERQGDRARGELGLDACDELHEERLERDRARRSREHEAARVGPRRGERARGSVRVPAELVRDRDDAVARVVRHARPSVECVRDGALGDAGALGDVLDRDPAASLLCHSPASFARNAIRRSMLFTG